MNAGKCRDETGKFILKAGVCRGKNGKFMSQKKAARIEKLRLHGRFLRQKGSSHFEDENPRADESNTTQVMVILETVDSFSTASRSTAANRCRVGVPATCTSSTASLVLTCDSSPAAPETEDFSLSEESSSEQKKEIDSSMLSSSNVMLDKGDCFIMNAGKCRDETGKFILKAGVCRGKNGKFMSQKKAARIEKLRRALHGRFLRQKGSSHFEDKNPRADESNMTTIQSTAANGCRVGVPATCTSSTASLVLTCDSCPAAPETEDFSLSEESSSEQKKKIDSSILSSSNVMSDKGDCFGAVTFDSTKDECDHTDLVETVEDSNSRNVLHEFTDTALASVHGEEATASVSLGPIRDISTTMISPDSGNLPTVSDTHSSSSATGLNSLQGIATPATSSALFSEKVLVATGENTQGRLCDVNILQEVLGQQLHSHPSERPPSGQSLPAQIVLRYRQEAGGTVQTVVAQTLADVFGVVHVTKILDKSSGTVYKCHPCEQTFGSIAQAAKHMCRKGLQSKAETSIVEHSQDSGSVSKKPSYVQLPASAILARKLEEWRESKPNSRQRSRLCVPCNRAFDKASELHEHKKSAHPGDLRPYMCEYCSAQFKTPEGLDFHISARHAQNLDKLQFQCSQCGKKFAHIVSLKRHEKKHTKVKYPCPECDKSFTIKAKLGYHMLRHKGEKPHECSWCGRRFVTKCNLDCHVRTHTGYKPHKCHLCDAAYPHRAGIKQHMLAKHNIKM